MDGSRLPSERELGDGAGKSLVRRPRARTPSSAPRASSRSRQGSGSIIHVPYAASSASSLIMKLPTARTRSPSPTRRLQVLPVSARAFESAVGQAPRPAGHHRLPAGRACRWLRGADRAALHRPRAADRPGTDRHHEWRTSVRSHSWRHTVLFPLTAGRVEGCELPPRPRGTGIGVGGRLSPLPMLDSPWDSTALASTVERIEASGSRT